MSDEGLPNPRDVLVATMHAKSRHDRNGNWRNIYPGPGLADLLILALENAGYALAARSEPREVADDDLAIAFIDSAYRDGPSLEPRGEELREAGEHLITTLRTDLDVTSHSLVEARDFVDMALAATPPAPALHPDDGHEHRWGCRLCGVDSPPAPALDVLERLRQRDSQSEPDDYWTGWNDAIDRCKAALAPERQ